MQKITKWIIASLLVATAFTAFALFEDRIIWQYCQLKSDNTYTDWQDFGNAGKGAAFATTMPGGAGIYRIRFIMDGNITEYYVWKKDEDSNLGSRKKGDPNHIGVSSTQIQNDIRDSALSQMGSAKYARANFLPAEYGCSAFRPGTWKCNAFVAHRCTAMGAFVPIINGPTFQGVFYPRHPPTARQWAGMETTGQADELFSTDIPNWPLLPVGTFPQPGYVVSNGPHCGIVDFDGLAIAAGEFIVHRKASHNLLGSGVRYRRFQLQP